jgi:hypothetical protein
MLLALLVLPALVTACSGDTSGTGAFSTADAGPGPSLVGDDATTGDDASAVSSWPAWDASAPMTQTADDAATPLSYDAGSTVVPTPEAGPDASCTQPLGAGVLMIDELMIQSISGTGDYGEWVEVASTSTCAVNLNGLHGETPVGSKLHTFDVTMDMWLPPGGSFLVADTADPAINHYLPGPLVTWAGQPGDVLRNDGSTVTLSFQDGLVDTVTYPKLKLVIGVSVEFPSDCPSSSRSDWTTWQLSTSSWFPGFFGTPNAPNDDVMCP